MPADIAARSGVQVSEPSSSESAEIADEDDETSSWSPERQEAEKLVAELIALWGPPMETLSRAGRAFEGLEFLLGGGRSGTFDLQVIAPPFCPCILDLDLISAIF